MSDSDTAESSTDQTSETQRKVVVSEYVSLDGVMEAPGGKNLNTVVGRSNSTVDPKATSSNSKKCLQATRFCWVE